MLRRLTTVILRSAGFSREVTVAQDELGDLDGWVERDVRRSTARRWDRGGRFELRKALGAARCLRRRLAVLGTERAEGSERFGHRRENGRWLPIRRTYRLMRCRLDWALWRRNFGTLTMRWRCAASLPVGMARPGRTPARGGAAARNQPADRAEAHRPRSRVTVGVPRLTRTSGHADMATSRCPPRRASAPVPAASSPGAGVRRTPPDKSGSGSAMLPEPPGDMREH